MATAPIANPDVPINKIAYEMTQMHLQHATQLAGANKDWIPALVVALAINRQMLQDRRDSK